MTSESNVKRSDIPSLRSLLVVEERMRSIACLKHWSVTGRASGLRTNYPAWNVLAIHSSFFDAIPSVVWDGV